VFGVKKSQVILLGVYSDRGVGHYGMEEQYAKDISSVITGIDRSIKVVLIDSKKINEGILSKLHVVLFPGGSGGGQSESLGEEGRSKIINFVKEGGGYIGICAGAYLAQKYDTDFSWRSLKISPAKFANDTKHWNRGSGIVKVEVASAGYALFPELRGSRFIYLFYSHGPLLVPFPGSEPSYEKIFIMKSNVYHDNPDAFGESPGTTMLLRNFYGKGRVVLSSAHPEFTPGLRWMLPRMVRWAAKRKYTSYPYRFVVTNKFKREIMFTPQWKQKEKERMDLALGISPGNSRSRILALRHLIDMGSIDLCEHYSKLMEDPSGEVRKKAAEIVQYYDYMPAVPNLQKALRKEKLGYIRRYIKRALNHLNGASVN